MASVDSAAQVPAELVPPPVRLLQVNLGCGMEYMPGWVNLDIVPGPLPDMVAHDLDQAPWPFGDESVERIKAFDIFEHIDNPVLFMTECHRILAPGGVLHIRTTYWKSENAYTDPTHKRFCTQYTFDYWTENTDFHYRYNSMYGGVTYRRKSLCLVGQELDIVLERPE